MLRFLFGCLIAGMSLCAGTTTASPLFQRAIASVQELQEQAYVQHNADQADVGRIEALQHSTVGLLKALAKKDTLHGDEYRTLARYFDALHAQMDTLDPLSVFNAHSLLIGRMLDDCRSYGACSAEPVRNGLTHLEESVRKLQTLTRGMIAQAYGDAESGDTLRQTRNALQDELLALQKCCRYDLEDSLNTLQTDAETYITQLNDFVRHSNDLHRYRADLLRTGSRQLLSDAEALRQASKTISGTYAMK